MSPTFPDRKPAPRHRRTDTGNVRIVWVTAQRVALAAAFHPLCPHFPVARAAGTHGRLAAWAQMAAGNA